MKSSITITTLDLKFVYEAYMAALNERGEPLGKHPL